MATSGSRPRTPRARRRSRSTRSTDGHHGQDDDGPSVDDVTDGVLATVGAYIGLRALRNRLRRRADTTPAAGPTPVPTRPRGTASPGPAPGLRPTEEIVPAPAVAGESASRRHPTAHATTTTTTALVLIDFCVDLEDLLEQPALREKAHRALTRVGVDLVDPTGEVFDAERHCAVGSVETSDPALHDRIASVERLGFVDRGRELRLPDVKVWRLRSGGAPEEEAGS